MNSLLPTGPTGQAAVTDRLGELAATLDPSPVSLVLFGSFVRGEASAASDLDVLVVIPDQPEDSWMTALSGWVDDAARIAGNPVNFIVEHVGEIASLGKDVAAGKRPGSLWEAIGAEGVVIHGASLDTLGLAV